MQPFFKNKRQEYLYLAIFVFTLISFYVETDIYTPSFPDMVDYFQTNENYIQALLSINFFGFCISSLFFGPASDAYGRKKILTIGLGIFVLGSMGCSFANDLNFMILSRFLQGIGCGSIVSAGLASFFDIYPPEKSSSLVSVMNGMVGGMMALAPIIGNWINIELGWRYNFYLIAFMAALSFVSIVLFTKETLAADKRIKLSLRNVLKNYGSILANFPFMAHTTIWCLIFSLVIVFIANLSLIFVDYLKVSKEVFGYFQATIMGTFFCGSMGAAYVIKKLGLEVTKIIGCVSCMIGIVLLALQSYMGWESPVSLISTMALISFGAALAVTFFSFSMTYVEPHLKGSATSLSQSFRLFISSALVWTTANAFDGSITPISYTAVACMLTCLTLYVALYAKKQHQGLSADITMTA